MFLRSLEIRNFRSIEHVRLDGLERLNVIIGRNNSGKSAIFGALYALNSVVNTAGAFDWHTVPPDLDSALPFEVRLRFDVREDQRVEFVKSFSGGYLAERLSALLESPFGRQLTYYFGSPPGNPSHLHLRETQMLAEDGAWATVQRMTGKLTDAQPNHMVLNIPAATADSAKLLDHAKLRLEAGPSHSPALPPRYGPTSPVEPVSFWPMAQVATYLSQSFFFNSFRHSQPAQTVSSTFQLSQSGDNLALVLHTINSNNRRKFLEIEHFVQAALPDIGMLQTPLDNNQTRVVFIQGTKEYPVRLQDMGTGVEQLLMTAAVLATTSEESTIFLEEPESHLHAGAQRFLLERISRGDRQVFLTTHSPMFVNTGRAGCLYQTSFNSRRTQVRIVHDAQDLSQVLDDIGVRNSDVLLSDAVLFVEGSSDQGALNAWSETLDRSFAEHNIAVLAMGGGEHAGRTAPVRSNTLAGISKKAPVPHMFVLDRDERSTQEVEKLQKLLGPRVRFLRCRELENYLLSPPAIISVLREKNRERPDGATKLDAITHDAIRGLIDRRAGELYGLVLLKRIRSEVTGLIGGLLPRELCNELAPQARTPDLAALLQQRIRERFERHVAALGLDQIVAQQKQLLDDEWRDPKRRLEIAPGEELIEAVFEDFRSEYKKPSDTERLARAMPRDEIPLEIKELIKAATELPRTFAASAACA